MKEYKLTKIDSKRILSALPQGAAAALLSAALSALIISSLLPESAYGIVIGAVMLLCAVFSLLLELLQLPKAANILIPTLSASVGAVLLFIPRGDSGGNLLHMLAAQEPQAKALIIPSICFCCLLCWGVGMVNRSFVLRCITAGGIALSFVLLILTRMSLQPVIMVLLLTYALIVVCQIFAPEAKNADGKRHEPWYVFVCLAAAIIALRLPMPQTRIPWEKVFQLERTEQLEQIGQMLDLEALESESEEIKNSGFNDDVSSIGGWIEVTSGSPIEVSFIDGIAADRLTGSIYDEYTGKGWLCTVPIAGTGYVSDSDITPEAGTDARKAENCARAVIRKLSTRGGTIFFPPYTVSIATQDNAEITREAGQLVFSESRIGSYTAYFADSMPDCALTDRERQAYLALPEDLPTRISELAHDAVSAKNSDAEKAEALMKVLSAYSYETKVDGVPEESDFVDHFLFSSREGYCVYFASAMAVLARCEGIPSRLVIGYAVPESDEEIISIGNENAHAWAELYIEGAGWVVYDPAASDSAAFDAHEDAQAEENTEKTGIFDKENLSGLKQTLLYTYISIAAAIALFFFFRPFARRIAGNLRLAAKYRHKNGYPVLRRCSRLMWTLSACGINRETSETANEFGSRVTEQYPWLSPSAAQKVRNLLADTCRVLYSGSDGYGKENYAAARAVRRAYIKKHGRLRYIRGWWRAKM